MAIKKEVGFGVNSFNKANVKSYAQSAADLILLLLLSKPGDIPNLPYLGINIKKYMYCIDEEFKTDDLKNIIYNQCNDMFDLLVSSEMSVFTTTLADGSSVLVIYLPLVVGNEVIDNAIYAFTKENSTDISYKYSLESYLNRTASYS